MRFTGYLLLLSGWIIVLAVAVLRKASPQQAAFVLAGMGVEALGLVLVARAHLISRGESG